jgi:serine/threonine protein phosphatase 1
MVAGRHTKLFSPTFLPPKLVVCGHYIQHSGQPYTRGQVICLDTGSGTIAGRPLTALLLPEGTVLQA